MNETAYLKIRAQHFSQLAMETLDPHAKAYYGAIAADVTAKFKVVNPKQPAILICGVAADPARGAAATDRLIGPLSFGFDSDEVF